MADLERKSIPFRVTEVKAADDGGWEVAGYASTWCGQPDSWGDVVARGAFTASLARRTTKLLWQHDMGEPIGKQLDLREDDTGLFGRWSLIPTDAGTKAHQLLLAELVDALSIGFVAVAAEYRDDGVRVLKEVDLYEVSLVTIPANPNAVVTSFKQGIPFDTLLRRATDLLATAVAEAQALHGRRAGEHRALGDRHNAAIDGLLAGAQAAGEALAALRVEVPAARAAPDPEGAAGVAARLELARRRLAPVLRESA